MINTARANAVDPRFEALSEEIQALFFSRNPRLWPFLGGQTPRAVLEFREQMLTPGTEIAAYPDGPALYERLKALKTVPTPWRDPADGPDPLLPFAAALSKNWEHPSCVENAITMASDPALFGAMMGMLVNPNLVYYNYAEMAADLEQSIIRQVATLTGYDPAQAAGIFTQGGTFCNLYGYLLGIRKSLPDARSEGMGSGPDYRIINSQGGHYSNITNLSLLGVNIRDKTIRVKLGHDNSMDLTDLEAQLEDGLRRRLVVPTIMLTMGTTDTFAVDDIKAVWDVRERLCAKYGVTTKPHIHVDSAIGWPLIFFLDYNFNTNPLHINEETLAGLARNVALFRGLRYADSFTVDFQKWGYVPYTSSLLMIRDRGDLKALENDPENFSYFESDLQEHTHLKSTIECSRGAAGVFGAHAALQYMGVRGYQVALANGLQNANYLRHRLSEHPHVAVVAADNQGPSVGFRIYDPHTVPDAAAELGRETAFCTRPDYIQRVITNTGHHRQSFLERAKTGLFTNWVQSVAHTSYDVDGNFMFLPGEKAVFINPRTTRREIDVFADACAPGWRRATRSRRALQVVRGSAQAERRVPVMAEVSPLGQPTPLRREG